MAPTSAATSGLLLSILFAAPPPAAHAQSMGLPSSKHSGSIPASPVAPPPASASITNGVLTVTVNAYGVVTNVTPNGWIPTFGPRVEIVPLPNVGTAATGGAAGSPASGIVEWYGLYFNLPGGPVAASATGPPGRLK